jgi:hypothetical protein
VAYDVSKRPAEWTTAQAEIQGRRVLLLAGSCFAIGALILLLKLTGAGSISFVPLVLAIPLLWRAGNAQLALADQWLRGAASERAVGNELDKLRHEGFVLMHDVARPGAANIDHVASGSTGVFVIETKHRSYLERHLRRTMHQALALHRELDIFVTPVICLERRSYGPVCHRNVWIVGKNELLPFIRSRRKAQLPFERLATWADRL